MTSDSVRPKGGPSHIVPARPVPTSHGLDTGPVTLPFRESTVRVDRVADGELAATEVPAERKMLWQVARRLGPNEFRRRFVHILPGLLPLILINVPHRDPVSPTLMTIMIVLALVLSAWAWLRHSAFVRQGEKGLSQAVLGYAGVVLGMLVMLRSTPELGLAVMGIIAFGDGSATLVGLLAGGARLPWNREKSWAGLAAFAGFSIPLATLIYWGEAQPRISVATAFACTAPAALAAGLAESLASRINDNIRVGLAAAMTILLTHAMFVGW